MSDHQACQACVPEPPKPWWMRKYFAARIWVGWQLRLLWARTGYRPFSRFIHRFGIHHMEANRNIDPTGTLHWCHWCGLRAFEKNWRDNPVVK